MYRQKILIKSYIHPYERNAKYPDVMCCVGECNLFM